MMVAVGGGRGVGQRVAGIDLCRRQTRSIDEAKGGQRAGEKRAIWGKDSRGRWMCACSGLLGHYRAAWWWCGPLGEYG
jgi:hypothetical protein